MKIEFQPIVSLSHIDQWAHVVEAIALFRGQCCVHDLDWDEDELLTSLIEHTDDPILKADYEAERNTGIQDAKDRFLSELKEHLSERANCLPNDYPYKIVFDGAMLLERKPVSEITEFATAYIWLSLFWMISEETDHIVIEDNDKKFFNREFAKIFECICCLVMARRSESLNWHFGDCRDVKEFIRRLQTVVNAMGYGAVKAFEDLEENQTGANDAGIDLLSIPLHYGELLPNSVAYLVGVTIQKSDRRHKIIDSSAIVRFRNYFKNGPLLSYQGVLAIPFEGREIERQNCRDNNSTYLTKWDILRDLGRNTQKLINPRHICRPRRHLREKSRSLSAVAVLATRSGDCTISLE